MIKNNPKKIEKITDEDTYINNFISMIKDEIDHAIN